MDLPSFISVLGRLGIPPTRLSASDTTTDLDTLKRWLQTPAPWPAN